MYPNEYNKDAYISWHKGVLEKVNLESELSDFRRKLKSESLDDIKFLNEILYAIIPMCRKEYQIQHKVEFEFNIPLSEVLKDLSQDEKSSSYDLLFKSVDSIINKLWRRNKESGNITIAKIPSAINDLVRTEIICSSLPSAKFVSERLTLKNINLPQDSPLKEKIEEKILRLEFEPEMKMSSGYFAYHGFIEFKTGLIIEIQIYSSLSKSWRKLSHQLYEQVRLNPHVSYDFGTRQARLISLGHLLHLAECEVERLQTEFKI